MVFRKTRSRPRSSGPGADRPEAAASSPADPLADLVEAHRRKAAAADDIAGVDIAHLADHRANPNVLSHAEDSRDKLHKDLITWEDERARLVAKRKHVRLRSEVADDQQWAEAESDRARRSITQGQADADQAADQLEAIRRARADFDPAQAASQAAHSRLRYVRAFLGYAALASVLSAIGLGALVLARSGTLVGAVVAGALGEAVMTVLVTTIISAQAALARRTGLAHDAEGTLIAASGPAWTRLVPWVGVAGLLAISIAANVYGALTGTGVFGVLGAVGAATAALCSFLGWAYSVQASAVIAANLADDTINQGMANLRERAAGAHIPPRPGTERGQGQGPEQAVQQLLGDTDKRKALLDALTAAELAEHPVPDNLAGLVGGGRPEGNPEGGTMLLPRPDEGASNGSNGSDQGEHPAGANTGAERATDAEVGADQGGCAPEGSEEPRQEGNSANTGSDQDGRAPHHQARIEQGRRNRERVFHEITANPAAGPRLISTTTGLSYSAVRGHISALKKAGRI